MERHGPLLIICEVYSQVGEELGMIANGEHGSGETAKKASQFVGAIRTEMFIVSFVVAQSIFCKTYSLSKSKTLQQVSLLVSHVQSVRSDAELLFDNLFEKRQQ